MSELPRIATFGECMLELNAPTDKVDNSRLPCELSYGGDSLNTSVYLARLGADVSYITAVGDDELSQWMVAQWQAENVNCEGVWHMPDSVAGMYLIELDANGERSFKYWRKHSPASRWLDCKDKREDVFQHLLTFDYFYLSGISLAILTEETRNALIGFVQVFRQQGGKVVFDGNYRANLWQSREAAAAVYSRIYQNCDIALPTFEDEQAIFMDASPAATLARLQPYAIDCIALKLGEKGCIVDYGDKSLELAPNIVDVVDTTSAGDAFNAGFIHKISSGAEPELACIAGQALASIVIQHRGAIIPSSLMPEL